MRERSLDKFESIFEQASIPVLDIKNVALTRLSVVLKGGLLDESILEMAAYLCRRFGAEALLHGPQASDPEAFREAARAREITAELEAFGSTAELVGQVSIERSQLVLLPEPEDETARMIDVDALVQGTRPPILLVRRPIAKPVEVFRRILHSLSGNFRQTQNFAYSFTLTESNGNLKLLHTIDENDLEDVRNALRVAPDIADETGEELLKSLARHGEQYLKAVVAASQDRPFDVQYYLAMGKVVPTVRAVLDSGTYGLLVVGSHSEGHSHVAASDYQLMHQVRDIPVLAL